jgi:GNAT superfamily N-acetyltransferase
VSEAAITLRAANADDAADILAMVHELAEFERAPDAVKMTQGGLAAALAASPAKLHALLAERGNAAVGCALWFESFSTWTGKAGMHMEDLFVRPAARGAGVGKMILRALARRAIEGGYARLEWKVLDWNIQAIEFYKSLGAEPQNEWTGYRLSGQALECLSSDEKHSSFILTSKFIHPN